MDAPDRSVAAPAQALRDAVRAAVARRHPLPDSASAIELIIESSTRLDAQGHPIVVDETGAPRFVERCGRDVPVTLDDLVDEFATRFPRLFAPPASSRDWLDLSSSEPPQEASAPRVTSASLRDDLAPRLERLKGRARVYGRALGRRITVATRRTAGAVPRAWHGLDRRSMILPVVLVAGLLAALFVLVPLMSRGSPERTATAQSSSGATSAEAARPETPQSQSGEPATTGAVPSERKANLSGVPEVLDTATLSVEGQVVHLVGVEWSRGAGNPKDLAQYIRGRAVTCRQVSGEVYRCTLDGQDLSRVVLYNGGGRTTEDAPPDLKTAEDHARQRSVGIWSDQRFKAKP